METVVYLIRHSVRFNNKNLIEKYNTNQSELIKYEKIILSVTGEKRAEILSNEKELQNIDERFDERRPGKPNSDKVPDWYERQFFDENYKTEGGESQAEVRQRMSEAFEEVVKDNKGKRIAIFSHGNAITFFLLKWCKLESVNINRNLCLSFNNKIVFNKRINSPDVFKITLNDKNEVIGIENIEFEDL